MIFLNLIKFHAWKVTGIFIYQWNKQALHYSASKFGNWITNRCKIIWLLRENSHIWHVVRRTLLCLWIFCQKLTWKREKDVTTYLKCDNVFRHSSSLSCWSCHNISLPPVLKIPAYSSHFAQATKCCCV